MRKIDKIIVHCSGTSEFQDFDITNIKDWHVNGNGWSDVGYHFIIKLDGTIQDGRPLQKIGAHCFRKNRSSIGICYIGGMNRDMTEWEDTRTEKQKESLLLLINDLKERFPNTIVYGHKDFTNKKLCPSFDAKEEYK